VRQQTGSNYRPAAAATSLSAAATQVAERGLSPVFVPPAACPEKCGVHEVVQGQVLHHRHTPGQNGPEFERLQRRRTEDRQSPDRLSAQAASSDPATSETEEPGDQKCQSKNGEHGTVRRKDEQDQQEKVVSEAMI